MQQLEDGWKVYKNKEIRKIYIFTQYTDAIIFTESPEWGRQSKISSWEEIISVSKELSKSVIPFARATLFPFNISLNKSIYFTAITDISTFTFLGKTETSTASLDGGFF